MKAEELSHYGPSICVKFHGDYVVAGYGVYIHVYEVKSGKLVNQSQIFHKNKVHGLAIQKGLILAYGARSVSIVPWERVLKYSDNCGLEKMCPEWIISAEFSFNRSSVFLLTSYNKVLCCDLELTVKSTKAVFGERAILYSGTITVHNDDKVMVNAGTVMDGIFVWDLFSEQTQHHFTDHEGSIFYVTASDDGKFLASCSDDRSIKLWDLSSGKLVSTGWGHAARIWNLQFFGENCDKLISVSEDCTCRVWDVCQQGEDLQQMDIFEVHLSKNVWGVDVDSERMIAVTSGNDGRIKLTDLLLKSRSGDESELFSMDDIRSHGIDLQSNEIVKGFYWLEFGLVVMTSEGRVLQYNQETLKWSSLLIDRKFARYSTTSGVQEFEIVIFAGGDCDLLILKFSKDGELLKRKSSHVEALSKSTMCLVDHEGENFIVALQSPNEREPLYCVKFNGESLEEEAHFCFAKPANFNSSSILYHRNFLILGSRYSTLVVFDLQHSNSPPMILNRILPGDAITSIRFVEATIDGHSLFSVTDRDGYYCFVSLELGGMGSDIVLVNKTSKGFLEGAYYDERGDYITYGFRSNTFGIYNETKQFDITSVLCGGSHRQWKFLPNFGSEEFVLIYVKASCINLRRFHKSVTSIALRNGLHGREIRDLTICPNKYGDNDHIFCSGAEDTTIKLNRLEGVTGMTKTVWTLRKHTSGLQRCKFVSDEYMISSAAREELYLWKVSTMYDSNPYIKILATLPPSTEIPDLRIMDFDVKFIEGTNDFLLVTVYSDSAIKVWFYGQKSEKFTLLGEGKYETCCLLNISLVVLADRLVIVVSPTDGHLVIWDLTDSTPVYVKDQKVYWKPTDFSTPLQLPFYLMRLHVHSAGIKTLQVRVLSANAFLVYTGGDDNAVAISEFVTQRGKSGIVGRVLDCQTAGAASTITSVNLLNNGANLITASVDQKLRYYNVSGNSLALKDVLYTTNADTGCVDVTPSATNGSIVLVAGVGFSAWHLDHEDS
ncbi:LADA_0D00958g1_1 [Lachancea dasiensis]|uniref:LADA_0D00958g1_1 n=1 Tax=Lachancea dasiensis TaxID=1072105 RepID=A0A1G4J4B4_9SACH|nr:LADA_0D00958g1_1 [Lachancea dasiensis]